MKSTKIALIIDTLNGGGAEKVTLILAQAMQRRGAEVKIIVLKKKVDYDIPTDIPCEFIFDSAKTKLYRKKNQIAAAQKITQIIYRDGGYDAIFCNLDECHPILAKTLLPRCVYVIHNPIESLIKRSKKLGPIKYWRRLRSFEALNDKNLITVSKGIEEEILEKKRILPQSVTTVYNPINTQQIQKLSQEACESIPKEPYIIFVGRIAEQKRLDVLLAAFNLSQKASVLVVLGKGEQKFDRMFNKIGSNKQVINIPFKTNPYPLIRHAQVLVLSSDFEGFGMVLAEAIACATPVVSTDCDYGPKEILTANLTSFLAPIRDPRALAEKIDLAITSPPSLEQHEALQKFEEDGVVSAYFNIIDELKKKTTKPPIPITFYLPNIEDPGVFDTIDPYESWKIMPRGEGFWILQTYCFLKHFGLDVCLSNELPKSGIVIFHRRNKAYLFAQPQKKLKSLTLVGCRGDLHDLLVPDVELLQNSYFADGETRFAMPHWPMPHIVPRDKTRGDTIKRIAFKGFSSQLHPDFLTQDWTDFCEEHNLEWVPNAVSFTKDGQSQFDDAAWADYSDIDLIIAVRPERNDQHTNKPALKLYNAWLAGVPAILGYEYAYREAGIPGEDYIEIRHLDDVKNAICELLENPERYRALIENGQKKSAMYTHEAVFQAWQSFLVEVLPQKIKKQQSRFSYGLRKSIPLRYRYRLLFMWKWLTRQRMR